MSLLKIVVVGFAIVMTPAAVVGIVMFLGLPSPVPSLIGRAVFCAVAASILCSHGKKTREIHS